MAETEALKIRISPFLRRARKNGKGHMVKAVKNGQKWRKLSKPPTCQIAAKMTVHKYVFVYAYKSVGRVLWDSINGSF